MALQTDPRIFTMYVTHVDGDGPFLRICGQQDKPSALVIESLIDASRNGFESGIGAATPASIVEGKLCVAKYKDGAYYRAKIVNTSNIASGLIGVHFIDYGNKDVISLSTIRFLDTYDPVLTQMRGLAIDYILARFMNVAGHWEEHILLKIQTLLCNIDYSFTIDANTRKYPLISINYQGTDLSDHLIHSRYGNGMTLAEHESLLQTTSDNSRQTANYQRTGREAVYNEHVPFINNQNFPSNPASTMRLQQNISALNYNRAYSTPSVPVSINQRLLMDKIANRNVLPTRTQIRTGRITSPAPLTPPPQASGNPTSTSSPKKIITYKSRLLELQSQHNVYVSCAEEGPELFAVQLESDGRKLETLMTEINKRPLQILTEPPMIGTVCLGRDDELKQMARAIVMNMSGANCKLFFVDFGSTKMVSYYEIFDIPQEFVQPNVFALRFCLSGVNKLRNIPQVKDRFIQMVKGKVLTLKVVPPEGPPLIQYADLYLNNQNVSEMLIAESNVTLEFQWLGMLPLGSSSSVLVSYVDSCVKFFVQLSDMIGELNAVMANVRVHCEQTSSPGQLSVGSVCCAKFPDDGNWYRAHVRETKGNNRVVVAYVDYGNEQEINVSDLRTITPELIELPAQAMRCALKGFESKPVESKTSNQLEMLALEKTLMAHVVGTLSTDTMLVCLTDDTVSPPLDVARRMTQLSQPRSSTQENKPSAASRTVEPSFSSPESQDDKRKVFRREKSFKEERRPPRDEDFAQRGGSFRGNDRENKDSFDRTGPARHSEKFAGRQDRSDSFRRGGPKPWENKDEEAEESVPPSTRPSYNRSGSRPWENRKENTTSASDDQWDNTTTEPAHNRPSRDRTISKPWENKRDNAPTAATGEWEDSSSQPTYNRQNRESDNRFNREDRDERRERRPDRADRRDNFNDRRDQKREYQPERGGGGGGGGRSNYSPRDRAERSFGSDTDKKDRSFDGDRSGRGQTYKPRTKFTQVQNKELPSPVPLETPFTEPAVEPSTQHEVSVTWLISPLSFYTQILSLQSKFLEMMQSIPEIYKGVKPFSGSIPVGASVLAKYPEDGVLYRSTVISVQPFGKFIVQYIDFGNKFLVDAKDIWQLDEQLMDLPKMAVHCSLLGVSPLEGGWKTSNEMDLCFNAPRYQCVFQDCAEGVHRVSLWNNAASVADMLVEKGLAVAESTTNVTLKDEAIDLTIIVGQQMLCRVTHVESFEKFYIQLDLEKVAVVENTLATFNANTLTPIAAESLCEDIHCTVRHEGKIWRAKLTDVSDTGNIKAVLPDYGNTITVSSENVMNLPTEFSVYYYQSLECCLNNYTEEVNKLMTLEQLKETLTNNKFIIYINDVDGIRIVSTLYDVTSGKKIAIFEPDEGAYEEVQQLCARAVYNYNFGMAVFVHAENLNDIYLQNTMDIERIEGLLNDLYAFYEEGTPEAIEDVQPEAIVAAKSSDGNWYRASVISVADADCKVQFSDYGNMETVARENLKKLDPKFYEPCALVLVAGLGLVALQDDAVAKLKEWVAEKDVQVTLAIGSDGWLASLHLDGVDLALKLINEQLATPRVTPAEESKVEAADVEPVSLPPGCTQVYISHIDSPGEFYLQMADKVDKIDEIQAELQTNSAAYENLEIRDNGTLCVAKYSADKQWYRAEILDSDADITTVRFIDYGNADVLDNQPGLLKIMPEHLKALDKFAVKSSVNAVPTGTGQWSESASGHFTKLVGDISLPVDALIVLKDISTYVDLFVNGQNITDKLVAEGHAARSEGPECGDWPSCFASHVNSPSEFWIQLESATPELQTMETAMVDAENFPQLETKEEGVICAAKYPEDGAWYRAQVIVDGSEGTEVLFMDYGNASITTELRSLSEDLKNKPALSRKCALQKPRDIKAWSRKSEVKFNEIAAEGATIFNVQFIASGDISIVELYHEGKSVTEELVDLCEQLPQTERPPPLGQDIRNTGKLSYVHAIDEFYIHLDDKTSELDKVSEKLGGAEEFDSASELKVGSLCTAFWEDDEQWYRAKILEFCDVGSHVQFIDYGNKAKCEIFKQLPDDLVAIEPLAKCCRLVGLVDSDMTNDMLKKNLESYFNEGTSFHVEFLDSTKEPMLVRLLVDNEDVIHLIRIAESDPQTEGTNEELTVLKTEGATEVGEDFAKSDTQTEIVNEELTQDTVSKTEGAIEGGEDFAKSDPQTEIVKEELMQDPVSKTEGATEGGEDFAKSDPQTEIVNEELTQDTVSKTEGATEGGEDFAKSDPQTEIVNEELTQDTVSKTEGATEGGEDFATSDPQTEIVNEELTQDTVSKTEGATEGGEDFAKSDPQTEIVNEELTQDTVSKTEGATEGSDSLAGSDPQIESTNEELTQDPDFKTKGETECGEDLDTSQPDLNESVDSSHTVIENKSFNAEQDLENLQDYEDNQVIPVTSPTPTTDSASLDVTPTDVGDSLENSNDTKTADTDESKDSIADTGYTTELENENSPASGSSKEQDTSTNEAQSADSPKELRTKHNENGDNTTEKTEIAITKDSKHDEKPESDNSDEQNNDVSKDQRSPQKDTPKEICTKDNENYENATEKTEVDKARDNMDEEKPVVDRTKGNNEEDPAVDETKGNIDESKPVANNITGNANEDELAVDKTKGTIVEDKPAIDSAKCNTDDEKPVIGDTKLSSPKKDVKEVVSDS